MSTGYLGNRSDQQIGDITFSYNKTNAAGNALLATNGAMLDAKKYPLLAAKLGTKLEPAPFRVVHPQAAGHYVAQSDDGEYCYCPYGNDLNRYKKSANTLTKVVTGGYTKGCAVACSSNGQYVLFFEHDTQGRYKIYRSNDYGATFSTHDTTSEPHHANTSSAFVSRDGRHMIAMAYKRSYLQRDMIVSSSDFGVSWKTLHTPLSVTGTFSLACLDDLSKIYLVSKNTLFISTDRGKTWSNPTMDLPNNLSLFVIDPLNNDLMVASFTGRNDLFVSTNAGANWKRVTDPRLLDTYYLKVFSSVIAVISRTNNKHYLLISHDLGTTWHQSDVLSEQKAYFEPRIIRGGVSYFVQDQKLLSSKIEEITRLPLGNLNSERIIADKVV